MAAAPSVASSEVSQVLSSATQDATQTPVQDNSNTSSVSDSSSSSSAASSSTTTFGNWSLATYNEVALGSATYDQIRATYGNPTYLTADQKYAYATWQSQSGTKVSIVFTPSGDSNNVQLIASNKTQSGLQ
ncbi:hypothetical protein [Leuconostoc mesenteroides]|uniref:hypothetical protein n=1 Tax=Leuconostoc mesenteroides TaxID=1245 RepID=UPI00003906D6|nr:hypothetical protein [Leuconostoc mesenteroides]